MLNASLEVAPSDREVQLLVDKSTMRLRSFFRETILKAKSEGEVSPSINPESTSEMLILLLFGLRVRTRSLPPRAELDSMVNQVKSLLKSKS